jgi:hypothetical protein
MANSDVALANNHNVNRIVAVKRYHMDISIASSVERLEALRC